MRLFPWANEETLVMAKTKEIKIKTTKPRLVAYTVHKGSYSLLGEVFRKWHNGCAKMVTKL